MNKLIYALVTAFIIGLMSLLFFLAKKQDLTIEDYDNELAG